MPLRNVAAYATPSRTATRTTKPDATPFVSPAAPTRRTSGRSDTSNTNRFDGRETLVGPAATTTVLPSPATSTGRFHTKVSPSSARLVGKTGFETSNARRVPFAKLFCTRNAVLSRTTMPGEPNTSPVPAAVSSLGPKVVNSAS